MNAFKIFGKEECAVRFKDVLERVLFDSVLVVVNGILADADVNNGRIRVIAQRDKAQVFVDKPVTVVILSVQDFFVDAAVSVVVDAIADFVKADCPFNGFGSGAGLVV